MIDAEYDRLVWRIRQLVATLLPADAKVAVVSRGDIRMLDLPGVRSVHFPADELGAHEDYYPRTDDAAVDLVERERNRGINFLVFPVPALWWLDRYAGLRAHLSARYRAIVEDQATCFIYALTPPSSEPIGQFGQGRWVDRNELKPGTLWFACNICGAANVLDLTILERETKSCARCQSSARWRALIDALSLELFGESISLPDFPVRRDLRGIGLSDWSGYSNLLDEKFEYLNTFFHKEPRLDIAETDSSLEGTADFLIASDVFEHVVPPIIDAFRNARRLLKPSGVFLFTVPWGSEPRTHEHYPQLNRFEIVEREGRKVVRNLRLDGVVEEHVDPRFHGGGGAVLVMRLFGKQELIENLNEAGFASIRVHEGPKFQTGVYWPGSHSVPVAARC